jgi:hypothetical protein
LSTKIDHPSLGVTQPTRLCYPARMRLLLVVLTAVLLLAGCGHAKDPFVGTWRAQANAGTSLVISRHGTGYFVVAAVGVPDPSHKGVGVLDTQGDTLTVSFAGTASSPAQTETIRLTVRPGGRLQAAEKTTAGQKGPGYLAFVMMMPATLVKVSNATAAPTPSP